MPSSTLILALAPFRDAVLIAGPLSARRSVWPEERVTVAAPASVCEILKVLKVADEVWEAGPAPAGHAPVPGAKGVELFRTAALCMRAQRKKFDSVIDLFPKVPSMLAALLATNGRSIHASPRYTDAFFGGRGAQAAARHDVDPAERIAGALGVATMGEPVQMLPDAESDAWIERALHAIGYRGGGPVLVVHTDGVWPQDSFVDVADRLRGAFGAWPVVIDTPREGRRASHLAGALGGSVLGIGAPTAGRFVASLARASLVLTDDSGVAYLAGLAHAPTVFLSGEPTPIRPRTDRVVLASPEVARIDPTAVFDAASQLMSKSRTAELFKRK